MPLLRSSRAACLLLSSALLAACVYDWNIPEGAAGDASPPADCVALTQAMDQSLTMASSCEFGVWDQCVDSVKDACGCNRFVRKISNADTAAYVKAVQEFVGAGCEPVCGAKCSTEEPSCSSSAGHCEP
ncbi:MAG TPA: hypothetical protein PLI95_18750 [Polyangiaceae bacterium]|nr:hypothetical protein [Polyangiaceae bacterium]